MRRTGEKSTLINEENGRPAEGRKKRGRPTMKKVSMMQLFRFADGRDKLLLAVGSVASIIAGAVLPINLLLARLILDEMVDYQADRDSVPALERNEDSGADYLMHQAWILALTGSMLGLLAWITGYIHMVCWAITGRRLARRVRNLAFRSIIKQEVTWFDVNTINQLNTKLTGDVARVEGAIGHKMTIMLQCLSQTICGYILSFVTEWRLCLVVLGTFPLLIMAMGFIAKWNARISRSEMTAYAGAGAVAEQALSAIRTVVAFGGEDKEESRYTALLRDAWVWGKKKSLVSSLGNAIVPLVSYAGLAVAYLYSNYLIMEDQITAGGVVLVVVTVMRCRQCMIICSQCMAFVGGARASAATLYDLIDLAPDVSRDSGEVPGTVNGQVEFQDIIFHYPSRPQVTILKGLSFSVEAGSMVAFVGHSGCGKSTILQLLMRFYRPDSGQVLLDGNDISTLDVKWLRDQVAVVNQEPFLFSTTIEENIRYGDEDALFEDIKLAAKQANALQFINRLPQGFQTRVGERGTQLSAGQKQRIAIARALLRNPRILVLDEATSALDTESEATVQAALDTASHGRTTIVVAHRLSTIRNANTIVVLEDGVVVETGSHDDLVAAEGVYYKLINSQMVEEDSDSDTEDPSCQGSPKKPTTLTDSSGSYSLHKDTEEEDPSVPSEMSPPSTWCILKLNGHEWVLNACGGLAAACVGTTVPITFKLISLELENFSHPEAADLMDKALHLSVAFAIFAILIGLGEFCQNMAFGLSGESMTYRLRKRAFHSMLHKDISWFDQPDNEVGALTARLAVDAALVKGAAGERMGMVLQALASIIAGVVAALLVDWRLTLIVSAFLPVILASGFVQGRSLKGNATFSRQAQEAASKFSVDALTNIRTVVALNLEERFADKFDSFFDHGWSIGTWSIHRHGAMYGISLGTRFFSFALAYYLGCHRMIAGSIEFHEVFFIYAVLVTGMQVYGNAKSLSPDLTQARLAAAKLIELFDTPGTIDSSSAEGFTPMTCAGSVELDEVTFRYPNRQECRVLRELKLQADVGQTVALVGASGSGKSTIIQLLERFYDPEQGCVVLDGRDIKALNVSWLRRQLGLVSQEPVLFDMSLRDNIAYGDNVRDVTLSEVMEAAIEANIHHFIKELPQGYDTRVGERGAQLSAGQKQRVAIARALVRKPCVLLLDEATSALDNESEKVVQEALDKARIGRTCIVIAHRLSTIQNADLIYVVHHGRIVEQGTHQDLMEKRGYYYRLQSHSGQL